MIERLAVALCTAVFAGLTLLAYSFIALALFGRMGNDFAVLKFLGDNVFSQVGIGIIAGAALLGFAIGGERMVAIFGVLWGTHSVWSRFNVWLGDKLEPLNKEYQVATPILIAVLVVLGVAVWLWLAP